MEVRIESTTDLAREAAALAERLAPGSWATLVTLSGELGAGKTAFTQELAKALGVTEPITSPTFVIEKAYDLPAGKPFKRLIHVDAYRLTSGAELAPLHFDETLEDAGNLILLEWPEKVADTLPLGNVAITMHVNPDGTRTLIYA